MAEIRVSAAVNRGHFGVFLLEGRVESYFGVLGLVVFDHFEALHSDSVAESCFVGSYCWQAFDHFGAVDPVALHSGVADLEVESCFVGPDCWEAFDHFEVFHSGAVDFVAFHSGVADLDVESC